MIKAVLFDYGKVLYGPVLPQRKVRGLAKKIRKYGIKTGIFSNVFLSAAWVLKITGGYRGFAPVVLSYREGCSKPDPKIYQIAIERSGVNPREILFIDNTEENVEAGKKAGMKTILAQNSEQVIADIKQILLAENKLQLK